MIYKRNLLYLKKQKARQTFANLPNFGCIHEGLFRIYTSYVRLLRSRLKTTIFSRFEYLSIQPLFSSHQQRKSSAISSE